MQPNLNFKKKTSASKKNEAHYHLFYTDFIADKNALTCTRFRWWFFHQNDKLLIFESIHMESYFVLSCSTWKVINSWARAWFRIIALITIQASLITCTHSERKKTKTRRKQINLIIYRKSCMWMMIRDFSLHSSIKYPFANRLRDAHCPMDEKDDMVCFGNWWLMSLAIHTLNVSLTTNYAHNETFSVITENYFLFCASNFTWLGFTLFRWKCVQCAHYVRRA